LVIGTRWRKRLADDVALIATDELASARLLTAITGRRRRCSAGARRAAARGVTGAAAFGMPRASVPGVIVFTTASEQHHERSEEKDGAHIEYYSGEHTSEQDDQRLSEHRAPNRPFSSSSCQALFELRDAFAIHAR